MTLTRKVIKVGDSLAVTLPNDFAKAQSITEKDYLQYYYSGTFIIFLTRPYDEEKLKKIAEFFGQ